MGGSLQNLNFSFQEWVLVFEKENKCETMTGIKLKIKPGVGITRVCGDEGEQKKKRSFDDLATENGILLLCERQRGGGGGLLEEKKKKCLKLKIKAEVGITMVAAADDDGDHKKRKTFPDLQQQHQKRQKIKIEEGNNSDTSRLISLRKRGRKGVPYRAPFF